MFFFSSSSCSSSSTESIYSREEETAETSSQEMTIEQVSEETTNNTFLPFDFQGITEELKLKAKTELHESEEAKKAGLRELKILLKEEKDLEFMNEDHFLVAFLRARKYDVKKAFALVKNFYNTRRKYYELYDDFDFNTVQHMMDLQLVGFLPYRDSDGSCILIIKAGPWNPDDATMTLVMRTLTSGLVQAITMEATQISGFKVIVDFKGFGMKQLTSIGTSYLWLFAEALQNCFPGRFRAVHIINEGPLFTYVWAVLKAVLTKKLRERFQFHGRNMKKLHKYISPAILPEEYGGELGPFDNTHWQKKMQQFQNQLVKTYSYGYKKK